MRETSETEERNTSIQNETHEKYPENNSLQTEIPLLKARLASKEALLAEKEQVITDLRAERDAWRTQAQTLLRTDQRQREEPPRQAARLSGVWGWLRGR